MNVITFLKERFFLSGDMSNNELIYYIAPLVIVYLFTTVIGAYTGLSVIKEMFHTTNKVRKNFLHLYSAFVLSSGMWVMHFISMLSHDTRINYSYDITISLLLICVVAILSFIFVSLVRYLKPNIMSFILSSVTLSAAILTMNYTGLMWQHTNVSSSVDFFYFLLSVIFALLSSVFSSIFLFKLKEIDKNRSLWHIVTSCAVGLTIFSVHFIGMKALSFSLGDNCCLYEISDLAHYDMNGTKIAIAIFTIAIIARLIYWKTNKEKGYINLWSYVPKIILLIGLVTTALVIVNSYDLYRQKDLNRFVSHIKDTESALIERYTRYEQALKGGKGLFAASNYVSHDEWNLFSKAQIIEESLPGINGIGYIEYVEQNKLKDFLDSTNKEIPEFKNHPKTDFQDKFIIKYIEPYHKNAEAVGLDIGFEANRREAAETSKKTGKPTLTRKIDLVQDDVKRAGFLLLLPLDQKGNSFQGWVYAPFIGENFLNGLQEISGNEITMAVYDGKEKSKENIIYKSDIFSKKYLKSQVEHITEVHIAEKNWTIHWQSTSNFSSSLNHFTLFLQLIIGLAITGLLAIIAHSQNNRTETISKTIKETTGELRTERRFSELMIETIPDYFFVKDRQYRIIKANNAFLSLYPEDKRSNIIGTTAIENHTDEDVEKFLADDKKAFETGFTQTIEKIKLLDGRLITLDTTKVKFENQQGEEFILGLARDVSELQNAKDNLEVLVQERTKELEKANASKDLFLANMSHELRTPLNSILGLIKLLLLEDKISDDYKDTLRVIEKSATSLLEIVNNILDLSKIEAEKVEIEHKVFNISGLLFSILEMSKPLASGKNLKLKTNFKELDSINVIGDEFRLTRIILNLVSNAIKYTEKGYVDLNVDIQITGKDKINFVLRVEDTGIGIAEDKLDHVFDKFAQAEESTERQFGGTGLGLHITKTLTELLGGKIEVKSQLEEGSTFTIEIPFETTNKSVDEEEQSMKKSLPQMENRKPFSNAKILIAEDHEFNQIFVMKLLRQYGCQNYELVINGSDSVEKFKAYDYDAVLMDCHMPKMNGYDATRSIRKYEEKEQKEPTPIIAMTADAMTGTREACLKAGMDDYISKPIDIDFFKTVLERWFIFDGNTAANNGDTKENNEDSPIDLKILNNYTDGDVKQNKELLNIFYDKSKQDIQNLKNYLVDGESEEWSLHSHSLKGASSYVGAHALYKLAETAQNMKVATKTEREKLFSEIKEKHQEIYKYLKNNKLI